MATTIITADQGFDETYYLQAKATQMGVSVGECLAQLTAAGLSPAAHYSLYGYLEGLSPNAYFNASEYAASKAAAVGGGYTATQFEIDWYNASGSSNLYLHYLMYGSFEEGVSPSSGFDDQKYYEAKAAQMGGGATWEDAKNAIQAAGLNAISHYLLYGIKESLSYTPIADSGATGKTYPLTTGKDTFTGGSGDDTFDGSLSAGVNTLQSYDTLNGGGGTDTLIATLATDVVTTATTLQNIENIQVYTPTSGTNLDLTSTTGVNEVGITATAAGDNFTFSGLSSSVTTLDVTSTAGGGLVTFGYSNAAVSGSDNTVTLNLTNVGTAATQGIAIAPASGTEGVETLNIKSSGSLVNDVTLTTGTATDLTTINASGSAALTLDLTTSTSTDNLATFNGADATGALKVSFGSGIAATVADLTVTGGSGNDTFDLTGHTGSDTVSGGAGDDLFNFGGTYDAKDSIDGGAGTNTLAITTASLPTKAVENLTDIQKIQLDGVAATAAAVNLSYFGSAITTLNVNGMTTGGSVTATKAASTFDSTVAINDAGAGADGGTFSVAQASDGGTFSLNLKSTDITGANQQDLNAVATGFTTLNVTTSLSSTANTGATFALDNLTANDVTTLNITSAKTLSLGGDTAGGGSSSLTSLTTINAGDSTGDITLGDTTGTHTDFSTANTGAAITMGSGSDTVVLGVGNGILKALDMGTSGAAGDTLVLDSATNGNSVIDLSDTTDQISTLLNVNNTVAQVGIENIDLSGLSGTVTATITGSSANNIIVGTSGVDTISAGAGNDTITGGAGADSLTGGSGNDTFVYTTLTDSLNTGFDTIQNLNFDTDSFDVATLPATVTTGSTTSTGVTAATLATDITTVVTGAWVVNDVALVTITGASVGGTNQTYLCINDGTAGYQAASDTVINVTGYVGTLGTGNFK